MPSLDDVFHHLAGSTPDPATLYLPLQPRAKNWPAQLSSMPNEIIRDILLIAPRVLFPSLFDVADDGISVEAAEAVLETLASSRQEVAWVSVTVPYYMNEVQQAEEVRIEFTFALALLERVRLAATEANISPVLPLVDLLRQIEVHCGRFERHFDELRSSWLLLRDAPPYHEESVFTEATVLMQHFGHMIRVTIGETDEDIDTWYQYEWLSPFIREDNRNDLRVESPGR